MKLPAVGSIMGFIYGRHDWQRVAHWLNKQERSQYFNMVQAQPASSEH